MTDDPFEHRLEALFAQAPTFDDTAAFTRRVERRLAGGARWRSDLNAAGWAATAGAALWAILATSEAPSVSVVSAQALNALAAMQDAGGMWLLPVLAVCGAVAYQTIEDRWSRD